PIFARLAPGTGDIPRTPGRQSTGGTSEQGYLHCGPNGAGHFVKMVHNGIEYGVMAAYAEGLGILRSANAGKRSHAVDAEPTPLPVLSAAIYQRFSSRGEAEFQNRVLSAMRFQFGGHVEKPGSSR